LFVKQISFFMLEHSEQIINWRGDGFDAVQA